MKHNRKLKKRIALITKQAEEYEDKLSRQNWLKLCDQLQGTLSTKRTWHILRALLSTTKTKTHQRHDLNKIIRCYSGTEAELLEEIKHKLVGDTAPMATEPRQYNGEPNPTLDSPFTLHELHAALAKLTRNMSPGHDRRTNKILRNLPDKALNGLLEYMNKCWEKVNLYVVGKPANELSTAAVRLGTNYFRLAKLRYPTTDPRSIMTAAVSQSRTFKEALWVWTPQ
ncbi:hypothetical protein HPB50_009876 [Hyalomma asiaticum]|uniref:Uncharacterized protein n=1 Tax=Hyalomma asiaticum TaxID=266040 RepID=A0ACB7RVE8_HYAAI|nr:hypothetical protein HPB50_009876 [Hyalomma asiaticum]